MQLTSTHFWLFFGLTFILYQAAPSKWRWGILLAASLVFYSSLAAPHLLVALAIVILVNYGIGRLLPILEGSIQKGIILWGGILINLLVLFSIRYLSQIAPFWDTWIKVSINLSNLGLTIGVSFFVFQAISYLVDVYLERLPAEKHLGYFALYLAFFPKLLQGPIERGASLLPRLHAPEAVDDGKIRSALLLILWGIFKKVVIADRLGILVWVVYDHLPEFTGISLWLATFYYAIQIYCDFSGYTDIAIGAARLLGIELSINFNKPYLAVSIADFWRRWHISFSTWIFEYLFRPLQISLRKWQSFSSPIALLITFILSGIWHGASWGFVVWGALHGVYMAVYALWAPYERRILRRTWLGKSRFVKAMRIAVTFMLVSVAWVFFRANSIADGWFVITHLFINADPILASISSVINGTISAETWTSTLKILLLTTPQDTIMAWLGIVVLLIVELPANLQNTILGRSFSRFSFIRWAAIFLLVMGLILFHIPEQAQFVYFQF